MTARDPQRRADRPGRARASVTAAVTAAGAPGRGPRRGGRGRRRGGAARPVGLHRAARGPAGRGAPGGAGWLGDHATRPDDRRPRFGSRLIIGTGGFRNLEAMARGHRGVGRRDGDGRAAPRGPARARVDRRGARAAGRLPAAEHRRLLHRPRRGHHRPARARGVRDRLGEARGDRRRQDAAARPRRAAGRRRGARGRRLRGAPLHERRPDPGAAARGRRLRGGDAARLADRQRHGDQQPLQPAPDRRAGRRAGDPGRRGGHRLRRRARDGGGLRRRAAGQLGLARRGSRRDGPGDAPGGRGRATPRARPAGSRAGCSPRRRRRPRASPS